MHTLHTLARFYPYWALVVAVILVELGIFYKRRRQRLQAFGCWLMALIFATGIGFWFYHRGDMNSDRWVKAWFE